jgi:carbon storage regulator
MGMLCLVRRVGESVIIDGDIVVKVLGINGGRVRIGFDAPKQVSVLREEVADRMDEEQTP